MVYFLQHWTVPWQICHGTEHVWHIIYSLFIPLSLSYLFHLLLQQFLTASISTLPHSFFFPFPFCSVLFPFMNMSHHRFPLYHHWSNLSINRFFFPLLFALSSLFYLKVAYRVVGLWLQIIIGVGLWVVGISSLFYLESSIRCSSFSECWFVVLSLKVSSIHREPSWFHQFVLHLLRTSKFYIKVLFLCLLFFVTEFESLNLYH